MTKILDNEVCFFYLCGRICNSLLFNPHFWEKNMRKVLGTLAFLLAVSVVAPAFTFAQDAPKEEKKEMKKKAKKEKKEKKEDKMEKKEEKK